MSIDRLLLERRYSSNAVRERPASPPRGDLANIAIALIAQDEPLVAVEHAQPFQHVVDGVAHAPAVAAQSVRQREAECGHGQRRDDNGHNGDRQQARPAAG
jgi:hypothetical protein